ncbi:MAG TPA: hypothetical protein VLT61_03510 [Anaeromyxobacteraceae bacterium]|nr:hypothetical protein [Anaeromyxobacteraceae bacterium]
MTPKGTLLLLDASDIRSERAFRNLLVHQVGLQPHEVARAVRRVRGLAEGRLVRERGWRGTSRDGSTLAWTQNPAVARRWRETGARVVRVTRIRKVRP